MNLTPSEGLTEERIKSRLKFVIRDGLASEVMAVLSGGAFLVALALKLGASNFQIGLLASVGTLASVFQLFAIYLIQKYRNRKAVVVYTLFSARISLIIISILPFLFTAGVSLNILIVLLCFHHIMGAISGLCWSSWMKDLIPSSTLGSFFGHRSKLIQITSIAMNFLVAFSLDYVKENHPQFEVEAYSSMFLIAAVFGLVSVYFLIQTPEPKIQMTQKNIFKLFRIPFRNKNFKNLMIFHALWLFAINLASPFFTVYLLKTLGFPLSYVITLTIISQLTNIFFIKIWGRYSDKYSNKTIIQICAPIYLCCILAWTFTTMPDKHALTIPLLVLIHVFSGISLSGINLSLSNIGFKLAPKGNGVIFLSARSLVNAVIGGIAPIIGGLCADFFSERELSWNLEWREPNGVYLFNTLDLQQWDFFFAIAFILGLISLQRLAWVKEEGEVEEKVIMGEIMTEMRREMRTLSTISGIRSMIYFPLSFINDVKDKIWSGSNETADETPPKKVKV